MSEKIWLSIGIRVLGLYLLITGIANIPNVLSYMDHSDPTRSVEVFSGWWHVGLYITFGYIFTFHSKLVAYVLGANDKTQITEVELTYVQIIQLIGIFLIVSSVRPAIMGTIPLTDMGAVIEFNQQAFWAPVASVSIGIIFFIKPTVLNKIRAFFSK